MPFIRPTLKDLISRIENDIQSRLPGTDPKLRRTILNIIARTLSGAIHGLYGYLDWMSKQAIIDTAEAEYLERWANIWGIIRKISVKAQGNITLTGNDGSLIQAGTLLQRSDLTEFVTDMDATIASGTATVAATAKQGSKDGNTVASSALSFVVPVSGVNNIATVDVNGIIGGVDQENDTDLRTRLLNRIQKPPQGGNANDYISWALEVAGVTRAWSFPLENGDNSIAVRFMMDDIYGDGIPQPTDVTTVQNYIDLLRPVTTQLFVVAPIPVTQNFDIILTPGNATVQSAVQAELKDLLLRDVSPGGVLRVSRINEAISLAAGETDHVLNTPAADINYVSGNIPVMGNITWS